MKKRTHVPGSKSLMPTVVAVLQKNGGILSNKQVTYLVLFELDLPFKVFKKARNKINFSGVYLGKIGFLKEDSKKGVWELNGDYMTLSFEDVKKIIYEKYEIRFGGK